MFSLVVFDWDGTLMDSEARIVGCLQAAARDCAVPEPGRTAARDVIGLGLDQAIATLFPRQAAAAHAQLARRYREHFLVLNQMRSELFPGVAATLADLAERGYMLAVATGKSRRGLDRELHETGLGDLFHATRCADETLSKPNPLMLLEVMDELGAEAGETLMVGDTEYDILMASNAGAAALGVSYGVHEPERLLASGALGYLQRLDELPRWLEKARLTA
ncbi:MAG: HAD-IA family hydrolase [Pseudomonadota bacterium]